VIQVHRLSKPKILESSAASWTGELCAARQEYYRAREAFDRGQEGTEPAYPRARRSRYAHQQVKRHLTRMFAGKCAYCESWVAAVSYQHVEHFRPQSVYPLLAYEWTNLLFACERCNSAFKRQQFPLTDGTQPEEDIADPCSRGTRDDNVLVDPCRDDPSEFFSFEDAILVCKNRRAAQTRAVCGLNRDDLKDFREKWLIGVETAAKSYLLAIRCSRRAEQVEFAATLKRFLEPSMPYIAMTRAKLVALGIDESVL
jgi:uncharacterized protein (TIGR02646 family)